MPVVHGVLEEDRFGTPHVPPPRTMKRCPFIRVPATLEVDNPINPEVLENLIQALGATPVRHRN